MNWIKVTDRLPEKGEDVLLKLGYGGSFDVGSYETMWEKFYSHDMYYDLDEVTHWLPLSEIPLPKDTNET